MPSGRLSPLVNTNQFECPLCSCTCRTQNHLREHLHEDHRKSAVIDAYLAALSA